MRTWQTCADEGIALYKCCQLFAAEECLVESVRRARNENAQKFELAQTLNNLAIVYYSRAKYQDAENILREALSLTQDAETQSGRLQRTLSVHIHTQMLIEQERFRDAQREIVLALQQLGDELKFCSAELWFSLVKTYVGLGQYAKADDAVDNFLETTPLSLSGPYRIYIDEACGGSYFGPGWNQTGSSQYASVKNQTRGPLSGTADGADTEASISGIKTDTDRKDAPDADKTMRLEADIRGMLVRASLKTQIPSQSRDIIFEVLELCDRLGDHPLTAQTLVIASRLAFGNSEWSEATKYCRRSLEIVEKIYGDHNPALLAYLINTASLTLMADGLPTCMSLMERTFKIVADFFGPRHPKYARCQLMWSGLMPFVDADNTDITATQERLVAEALDTFLDYFDDKHSAVFSAKLQLAEVLLKTDRAQDSEILLKQIVYDASVIRTTNPYPMIGCLTEMLKVADELPSDERYVLFDYIHRETSKIDCEIIEGTARQIDLMRQLAFIFQKVGDADKPEQLLRRCFEISNEVCSDLHHRCKQDLVELLLEKAKPQQARELLERVEGEKTVAQDLREQVQLVKVNIAMNRAFEAEQLALAALSQTERMLPDCSDSFMQLNGILIDVYVTSARLDEAVRMIGTMISRKSVLGVAALDVIPLSLRMIADAFAAQGDTRAEQLYQQSISAAEEIQGKSPETLDASIVAFADFCLNNGQIDKARKLFERWMELRSVVCGEDSYACAIAMLNVAEVNADHDLNKSLKLSSKALEIMDGDKDVDPEYLVAALHLRAAILEKANNQTEALAIAERARKLEKSKSPKKRKAPEA
ncbi:MAG: tetratricopeptide repeat-containing protein [Candidatus Melainabacteria bacterium]|nr:tetratricopeptide repeat-containing protein [Candidatus Melainabacteria bacterium]